MYLQTLDLKQKKAFLDASLHIIKADGSIARGELDLINEFCSEMNIKKKNDPDLAYDAAIITLNSVSTPLQRKQILIELTRLAYADNIIKAREEQMIKFAMDVFKISKLDYDKIVALVKDLAKLKKEINEYLAKK